MGAVLTFAVVLYILLVTSVWRYILWSYSIASFTTRSITSLYSCSVYIHLLSVQNSDHDIAHHTQICTHDCAQPNHSVTGQWHWMHSSSRLSNIRSRLAGLVQDVQLPQNPLLKYLTTTISHRYSLVIVKACVLGDIHGIATLYSHQCCADDGTFMHAVAW